MGADSKLFYHFWALKIADAVVLKTESVDGVEMELYDILNAGVPALWCLILLLTDIEIIGNLFKQNLSCIRYLMLHIKEKLIVLSSNILGNLFPFNEAFEFLLLKVVAFRHLFEILSPLLSDVLPPNGFEIKLLHVAFDHL